ncbi:MAG: DUF3630 family protein [Pyrinomonadaceae bacterium MAG19_C2-C3]|nr:DUF3630 family protein [Pyrinomonadaceae bacterium MAG19_C2-C3]
MNVRLIEDEQDVSLIVTDEADWKLFDEIGNEIVQKFEGRIVERLEGLEQRYLDIQIADSTVTLHLEHFMGISIFARDKAANETIKTLHLFLTNLKS